jgi:hypothetical protein
VYVLCNVNCVLPLIFSLFLPSFNRERSRKKLQSGTVLPVVSDRSREFAGSPLRFALLANQSAQKQVGSMYRLHETVFSFLIFYTECAIL